MLFTNVAMVPELVALAKAPEFESLSLMQTIAFFRSAGS